MYITYTRVNASTRTWGPWQQLSSSSQGDPGERKVCGGGGGGGEIELYV